MSASVQRHITSVAVGPLSVSRLGYGAMGLSSSYGPANDAESLKTLERAAELGITFFDTADVYGQGHNEQLLSSFIKGRRDRLVIATKFGAGGIPGKSPQTIVDLADQSLARLGIEVIDLYYLHRVDQAVPIEDTIGAMSRLIDAGKIRAIGLSEASAATLRKAHAIHPIAALQTEYSLWTRDVEAEILPLCRSLDIAFVAYSPLGRGFLAGQLADGDGDRRKFHPRFQADAVAANSRSKAVIDGVAQRLGASSAQIALAWTLAKGVIPIPGTRHISHLEANVAALDLMLDQDSVTDLDGAFPPGSTFGDRYPLDQMSKLNG
jgi:aryl-alcohol dehydrogenase-like predicted oxidoreductase